MILLNCELVCDVGCVRTNNEDIILLNGKFYRNEVGSEDFELTSDTRFSAIIADGMGGHNNGEVASELSVRAFDGFINELPDGLSVAQLSDRVKEWVNDTHTSILEEGVKDSQFENMGTTLVGMFSYEGGVFLINIGDSRLYRYREGILKQLTTDHSMRELTGNPSASSNEIYNSLGAGPSAFADFIDLSGQLLDEDMFLVCSDGLSDSIKYSQLEELFKGNVSATRFVEAAKDAGGRDNVSVILIKVKGSCC